MITKMRGFTLIETLLALAILAVLSAAAVMVLQREVTAFRLRFYADGRWQETWDRPQRLPQGLEITLTLANSGEITRLFLLTPGGGQ